MDHKEITEVDVEMDKEAFIVWWDNEGSEKILKDNDPISRHEYEYYQSICQEAWLNGAYKAREFNW